MDAGLDSLQQAYAEALASLSAAETQIHPEGDQSRWCVLELIEHLMLTYRSTAEGLEERLRKGCPTQAPVTPEHEARWREMIVAGPFPEGGKSAERVRPGQLHLPALSGAELTTQLRSEMEKMDELLGQCEEKFGVQPMATHFFFGPLSADQWRAFHIAHGRHHLKQMRRIMRATRERV